MKLKILTAILALIAGTAQAANFKGFKRAPSQESMIFTEQVVRYIESENALLILFSRHPAFYRFPKNIDYAAQVKVYLDGRILDKKPIKIEINPKTTEIISLGD